MATTNTLRVREAYTDRTLVLCRYHYEHPTADLPALGPVVAAGVQVAGERGRGRRRIVSPGPCAVCGSTTSDDE